jgi:OFA family oxalate/formate antiporter-like MFS transporter
MSPLLSHGLQVLGYRPLTRLLGICALVTGLGAASFLRRPAAPPPLQAAGKPHAADTGRVVTMGQTLQSPAFWCLWLVWGLAGGAGIATVTLSTTFGMARGLTLRHAVLILTAFNVTNGASRLIAGYLSDVMGRRLTMGLAFGAAGLGYLLLPHLSGLGGWMVAASVVGFAFGTLFAVSAPLIVDCFGMARFGAVFGLVFTAYAFVAGPLGPWLSGHILDRTGGNYTLVFTYLGGLCLVSALLIRWVRPPRP